MKRSICYVLIGLSVPLLLLALLFLVAAMQNPSRMYVAGGFAALGGAMMYFAYTWLSYLKFMTPENLEPLLLRVAAQNGGKFTRSDAMRRLNLTADVFDAAINHMLSRGSVTSSFEGSVEVYRAADATGGVKRKCEFCGTEFNVRDALTSCPNCGGNVKIS